MRRNTEANAAADTAAEPEPGTETDFDGFASYEDDGGLVICDRTNPRAWIRSETTATLEN